MTKTDDEIKQDLKEFKIHAEYAFQAKDGRASAIPDLLRRIDEDEDVKHRIRNGTADRAYLNSYIDLLKAASAPHLFEEKRVVTTQTKRRSQMTDDDKINFIRSRGMNAFLMLPA